MSRGPKSPSVMPRITSELACMPTMPPTAMTFGRSAISIANGRRRSNPPITDAVDSSNTASAAINGTRRRIWLPTGSIR